MFYVNMTDKFMSGWGLAPHKSYLSVACDTLEQAQAVEKAARLRPEMRYVTIASRPRRGGAGCHTSIKAFADLGGPWLAFVEGQ